MNKLYLLLIVFVCLSCATKDKQKQFSLLSPDKSGITFSNNLQPIDKINILDYLYFYNGGGVAIGDINNDGLQDIYFTGNQTENKLYLNKGNLQFEDITATSETIGTSQWNTGVTMADVNGDGLLDIYICAVTGIGNLKGKNELFINNGNSTFTESAKDFGLDFQTYATQASFFDYDNDGDLDMYLLNQAVHTKGSYGKATIRKKRHEKAGDRLLKNENNIFIDVSEEAGIYGGINGYGLGICTADFNNDGFTDIYVSNDFHEDDFYYLNQGNGTFKESIKQYFGHISRFSMGSDAADINNDGYYDLITIDMLPDSESVLKTSVGEDNSDIHNLKVNNLGYHYQFARNMLQINKAGNHFSETALLNGVAATDWSWSPLFADFNLDGIQDLFVSNGIPKRPNDLDYIKYVSNEEINTQLKNNTILNQEVINKMPSGDYQNFIFEGTASLQFKNRSEDWLPENTSFSNGSAYADLDNDGDLDIVSNNLNETAFIYENTNSKNHFLNLKLEFEGKNKYAIGSKVFVFEKDKRQYKQVFSSRGFQSSSELTLNFGFADDAKIDSILVVWPDNTFQKIERITTLDTIITIRPDKNRKDLIYADIYKDLEKIFKKTDGNLGINYTHTENSFIDFNRQNLIPYKISNKGPAIAVGDINGDGKDDIFFGGSKNQEAQVYIQGNSTFKIKSDPTLTSDKQAEDVFALIADFNKQHGNDIIVASAGGEYFHKAAPLLDRLYTNKGDGDFVKNANFPKIYDNTSIIKMADIDGDNDLDLFIGGYASSIDFGQPSNSYLLENTADGFIIIDNPSFNGLGLVTDAVFSDYDNDGDADLIVVGEWMAPTFFQNISGIFKKVAITEDKLNGLWQTIAPFDIDEDGDLDYVLGNWGKNSKFKASKDYPLLMYYGDFDENGNTETITAIEKEGRYYTNLGLDELAGQMAFLKKDFPSYSKFAGKAINEIFTDKTLSKANHVYRAHELASGYLENKEGSFHFVPFKKQLQVAPITNALVYDFYNNGKEEMLLAGNNFGTTPYHGRLDGFSGALILNEKNIKLGHQIGLNLSHKQIKSMNIVQVNNKNYVLVTINNAKAELYEIQNN